MAKSKEPKKQKKTTQYAYVTDDKELDIRFYQRYDENLLFNKAIALMCILEREEQFKTLVADFEDIDPSRINDKFFESLRAELHFTEMHQFEGFFALLIAIFSDLPDWIYLTAYLPSEIGSAIHQFIKKDIETLTGGKAKNDREFVSMAVYAAYEPLQALGKEKWDENLDNIAWLIRRMAEKYMEGKGEYNSYKHGMRVMTGESWLNIATQDQEGNTTSPFVTLAQSKDSLGYLEFEEGAGQTIQDPITNEIIKVFTPKKKKDNQGSRQAKQVTGNVIDEVDVKKVYEISKFFNPKESVFHLNVMNRLLTTMKNTRLASRTDKGQLKQLVTYLGLDQDEVLALREKRFEWRVTI